jgi:hypothetical protein
MPIAVLTMVLRDPLVPVHQCLQLQPALKNLNPNVIKRIPFSLQLLLVRALKLVPGMGTGAVGAINFRRQRACEYIYLDF